MNRTFSLFVLVAGIVLTIYGISALDSIGSDFSRFFTGAPTNKTMWLIIGGVGCVGLGLAGVSRSSKF